MLIRFDSRPSFDQCLEEIAAPWVDLDPALQRYWLEAGLLALGFQFEGPKNRWRPTGSLEKLIEKTAALTTTMTTDINSLQAEAGTQREVIRLAVATLKETVDTVNSTVSDVAAIATKNVEEHRTQLQALEEESAAILHTVQDHREKIKSDVKISAEMLSQVQGSLVSLTRLIVEKLNGKQV